MLLVTTKHCAKKELLFPFIPDVLLVTGGGIKSLHKLSQITSEFLSAIYHKYNSS